MKEPVLQERPVSTASFLVWLLLSPTSDADLTVSHPCSKSLLWFPVPKPSMSWPLPSGLASPQLCFHLRCQLGCNKLSLPNDPLYSQSSHFTWDSLPLTKSLPSFGRFFPSTKQAPARSVQRSCTNLCVFKLLCLYQPVSSLKVRIRCVIFLPRVPGTRQKSVDEGRRETKIV